MKKFLRISQLDKIENYLKKEKTLLLTWARQVWKTTILLQLQKKYENLWVATKYINCEDYFEDFKSKQDLIHWISQFHGFDVYKDWILILDEIQAWTDPDKIIKTLHDDQAIKCKILVTWSRFWWQKTLWASMVWRGKQIHIQGFSFKEFLQYKGVNIQSLKDTKYERIQNYLEEYLYRWAYPKIITSETLEEKNEELKQILSTWIDKDFTFSLDKKYKHSFLQCFDMVIKNIGNVFSLEKISAQIWVSKYFVQKMFDFMQNSFVMYEVPPFFTDKTKEISKNTEFFIHDLWLLRYRQNNILGTSNGKINENFVFQQLKRTNHNFINFYNKKNWTEIDFIYTTIWGNIIPIEVKSSDKCSIPPSFKRFYEKYHPSIDYFIVTTKSVSKEIDFYDTTVKFIPFWAIEECL